LIKLAASVEVAFSPGISSTSLRTYGTSKAIDNGTNSGSPSKYLAKEPIRSRRSSAATEDQDDTSMVDVIDNTINASARKFKREYKEPWVRECVISVIYSIVICIILKHLSI